MSSSNVEAWRANRRRDQVIKAMVAVVLAALLASVGVLFYTGHQRQNALDALAMVNNANERSVDVLCKDKPNDSTCLATEDRPTTGEVLAKTGATGLQGVQGIPGFQGVQGVPGPQGIQGVSLVGPRGRAGLRGRTGDIGVAGDTVVGPAGTTGDVGPQGTPGATGPGPSCSPEEGGNGCAGAQGPAIKSWTWTDPGTPAVGDETTYICRDPDSDLNYTCEQQGTTP